MDSWSFSEKNLLWFQARQTRPTRSRSLPPSTTLVLSSTTTPEYVTALKKSSACLHMCPLTIVTMVVAVALKVRERWKGGVVDFFELEGFITDFQSLGCRVWIVYIYIKKISSSAKVCTQLLSFLLRVALARYRSLSLLLAIVKY